MFRLRQYSARLYPEGSRLTSQLWRQHHCMFSQHGDI